MYLTPNNRGNRLANQLAANLKRLSLFKPTQVNARVRQSGQLIRYVIPST